MKKLILLLTLTMMFGQTKLETRVYDYSYNSYDGVGYLDIFTLTGYNLDYAKLTIAKVDDFNCDALNYCVLNMAFDFTSVQTLFSDTQVHYQTGYSNNNFTNSESFVLYDSQIDWEENITFGANGHQGWFNSLSVNFKIAITAEFPQEDTGYIEDGFDYCVEPGANLMSYPCDSDVALLDAIPADALSQFSGIIGQGLASVQLPNGTWVGSLTNMQASSGYWITSTTSLCFNYDCSEN